MSLFEKWRRARRAKRLDRLLTEIDRRARGIVNTTGAHDEAAENFIAEQGNIAKLLITELVGATLAEEFDTVCLHLRAIPANDEGGNRELRHITAVNLNLIICRIAMEPMLADLMKKLRDAGP